MAQKLHPENFVHDFPNGNVSGAKHALLSMLYVPMHTLSGLSGITLLTFMIGLEIACVLMGAWVLWSTVTQRQPGDECQPLRLALFGWLATMMVAGFVARPNLSNFGYPFFHGQFYGFADAISLVAIAACLKRRWVLVGAMLCLGFMVHPTKTLMAAVFIAGASLACGPRSITLRQLVVGAGTAIFAGCWAYFWLGMGQVDGAPPIPADQYIAYTRAWQYHWYPLDRGLVGIYQHSSLSPFLAMLLMGSLALAKSVLLRPYRRSIIGGLLALALLTVVGLWFSYALTSVFMIKMALIRASELMVLVMPFLILTMAYEAWKNGAWLWVILPAGFLLGGMKGVVNLSVVMAVIIVSIYFWQERKQRPLFTGTPRTSDRLLAVLAALFLMLTAAIWLAHHGARLPLLPAPLSAGFILVVAFMFTKPVRSKFAPAFLSWAAVSALFIALAGQNLNKTYNMDDKKLAKARDYYDVQRWAQEQTPKDALFMTDPCYAYGWRDFSQRSSIGTPFEWFHTGWLYVSDGRVFARGQSIGKTLGLDFTDRLPVPGKPAELINYTVCGEAQDLFYDPSLKPIRRMAREHNVGYFVMEKQRSEALVAANRIQPVFANSHYRVFAAKDVLP